MANAQTIFMIMAWVLKFLLTINTLVLSQSFATSVLRYTILCEVKYSFLKCFTDNAVEKLNGLACINHFTDVNRVTK
jgi:hypothetical protein